MLASDAGLTTWRIYLLMYLVLLGVSCFVCLFSRSRPRQQHSSAAVDIGEALFCSLVMPTVHDFANSARHLSVFAIGISFYVTSGVSLVSCPMYALMVPSDASW